MGKADYKRLTGKSKGVQNRERHRGIYCISAKWHRWAKKYLNRQNRRQRPKEED